MRPPPYYRWCCFCLPVTAAAMRWRRRLSDVDDDMESRYLRAARSTLEFTLDVPSMGGLMHGCGLTLAAEMEALYATCAEMVHQVHGTAWALLNLGSLLGCLDGTCRRNSS